MGIDKSPEGKRIRRKEKTGGPSLSDRREARQRKKTAQQKAKASAEKRQAAAAKQAKQNAKLARAQEKEQRAATKETPEAEGAAPTGLRLEPDTPDEEEESPGATAIE